MSADGYIRFQCEWVRAGPMAFAEFDELNAARQRARELGLIGVYPNGIGFGNISVRMDDGERHRGSRTPRARTLRPGNGFDRERNWVRRAGPIRASAELMTHAAIYQADSSARAVLHGHHRGLWLAALDREPTTDQAVEYGTPGMAAEIQRLFGEGDAGRIRFIVMGGHEEGLLSFGSNVEEALREYEERLARLVPPR
ncbi:MAG: class II aldolase/adducin family protein [Chthoniobacteraceae bacterium]